MHEPCCRVGMNTRSHKFPELRREAKTEGDRASGCSKDPTEREYRTCGAETPFKTTEGASIVYDWKVWDTWLYPRRYAIAPFVYKQYFWVEVVNSWRSTIYSTNLSRGIVKTHHGTPARNFQCPTRPSIKLMAILSNEYGDSSVIYRFSGTIFCLSYVSFI